MRKIEFTEWPKTPRFRRDIVITEKLDGTNSGVHIYPLRELIPAEAIFDSVEGMITWSKLWLQDDAHYLIVDGMPYAVAAQSRKRMITPGKGTDNYGFAGWVYDNAEELVRLLGVGLHFGEWWGNGIQRNYGMKHKKFSLFNTKRWAALPDTDSPLVERDEIGVVPLLAIHQQSDQKIAEVLDDLSNNGSKAAPGFMRPEGVIVLHTQSGQKYKVLLENDGISKTEAGVA